MPDNDTEVHRLLGEVVANQRAMFNEQKRMNSVLEKHFEDDKEQFAALGTRMRGVEQKVNYAAGAVAVVVSLVTVFWNSILGVFRGGA